MKQEFTNAKQISAHHDAKDLESQGSHDLESQGSHDLESQRQAADGQLAQGVEGIYGM